MEESNKLCEDCRHFRRHYVCQGNKRYMPINYGHCGNPRLRDKKPNAPACHRFSQRHTENAEGED